MVVIYRKIGTSFILTSSSINYMICCNIIIRRCFSWLIRYVICPCVYFTFTIGINNRWWRNPSTYRCTTIPTSICTCNFIRKRCHFKRNCNSRIIIWILHIQIWITNKLFLTISTYAASKKMVICCIRYTTINTCSGVFTTQNMSLCINTWTTTKPITTWCTCLIM